MCNPKTQYKLLCGRPAERHAPKPPFECPVNSSRGGLASATRACAHAAARSRSARSACSALQCPGPARSHCARVCFLWDVVQPPCLSCRARGPCTALQRQDDPLRLVKGRAAQAEAWDHARRTVGMRTTLPAAVKLAWQCGDHTTVPGSSNRRYEADSVLP